MRLRLPSLVVRGASKAKSYFKIFTPNHAAAYLSKKFNSSPNGKSEEIRGITTSRPPAMFAVVIGIDTYQDPEIVDLSGAAADADAVHEFLVTEVGIAKDRIVNLRNLQATRNAIITALGGLAINSSITADDPILIYYAGHGSETHSPLPEWWPASNGKIQMLLPCDFATTGAAKIDGQGVWDVTLSSILERIAHSKSDNITVVLDCCHSGSATRDVNAGEDFGVRGITLPRTYDIPQQLLEPEATTHRTDVIPEYHSKTGLRSHVLLASCKQGEGALENFGRGAFTTSLLELLRLEGIDQLTYEDVVKHIKLPSQNPQCEGVNQTRVLFNSKATTRKRSLYSISRVPEAGQYELDAGTAHGIVNGAQFAVYADRKMSGSMLGTVITQDTSLFNTRCAAVGGIPFKLSNPAYALQVCVGGGQALRLSIPRRDELYKRLHKEAESPADPSRRNFRVVKNPEEESDLEISTHNSMVKFTITDTICRQWGLTTMPFGDVKASDTERLLSILHSAADFYWNLRLSRTDSFGEKLMKQISLECFKLKSSGMLNSSLQGIMAPNGLNLNENGKIFVDVDEKATYGFSIRNNSALPLYAALFYYDMSDLSIEPYYLPGTAADRQVDFSIPVKGTLGIGFGDSGTPARIYYLRDNQDVDIGILKLYLSTQVVDFSSVAQASPFPKDRRLNSGKREVRPTWYTITIPIIQRRGSSREV